MKCICNTELICGGAHDYEDYGEEGDGIVTNYTCINKKCEVDTVLTYSLIKTTEL